MKEYIDEMLHLTADIAEELLAIKDTDSDVNEELCRKIRRLSFIADTNVNALRQDEKIATTDSIIKESVAEMMQDAENEPYSRDSETGTEAETDTDAETVVENETSEAMIDENRRETQWSEETDEETIMPQLPETAPLLDVPANDSDENMEQCQATENEPVPTEADDMPAAEEIEEEETSYELERAAATEPCVYTAKDHAATDEEVEAESAIFEESSDADTSDIQIPAPMVTASQLRNAFTLNDMFLFRRVLFGGSAQRFTNALEHIATLRSVDEIKEYLSESLHINPRSEEAKDFIGCISPLFGY